MSKSSIVKDLKRILKIWFKKSIYDFELDLINDDVYVKALDSFKLDYQKYFSSDDTVILEKIIYRPELQSIILYRISRILYLNNNFYCNHFSNLGRFLTGIEIYYSSSIGAGLKINHGIGTVIGARVTIGDNCNIYQGVTFGDKNGKRPIIGDNVTIYAGAKVLGGITVGNNAIIGANSVCFKNVPENAVAVGIPARIL